MAAILNEQGVDLTFCIQESEIGTCKGTKGARTAGGLVYVPNFLVRCQSDAAMNPKLEAIYIFEIKEGRGVVFFGPGALRLDLALGFIHQSPPWSPLLFAD